MAQNLMVKKRSGRIEPFDSEKMARAVSRAGVPYAVALEIAKSVKNSSYLANKEQVSSVTLREMVAAQLHDMNQHEAAKSYQGYKKTKSTSEEIKRSVKDASKVQKSGKTRTRPLVRKKEFK
jgi:2-phosphoglycerate kinase